MDKQSLRRHLERETGSYFITTTRLAKFLGMSREDTLEMMRGLDYFQSGRNKKYFVPDVAQRIMERRMMS